MKIHFFKTLILLLTSRVYPWFIAVVSFALQVELVEVCVYASVAVMLILKKGF